MSPQTRPGLMRAFDASFILGAAGTVAFYAMIQQPAMHDSMLHRYTTEHVVEYEIVAVFIWGIADIVLKLCGFPRQLLALRQDWLPARAGRESIANAQVLLAGVREEPHWLLQSRVGKRLVQALEFVTDKASAEEYREHLQYLADQDEDN